MEITTLSPTERLILANQYKILALVEDENRSNSHYLKMEEIVRRGYTGFYDVLFDSLSEEQPSTIVDEVHDIFGMFQTIGNSVAQLPEEEAAQLNRDMLVFRGFDGNHDPHYRHAIFMIEKLDLYDDFQDAYMNSHNSNTLSEYQKQLEVYNEVRPQSGPLSAADLKAIADAPGL